MISDLAIESRELDPSATGVEEREVKNGSVKLSYMTLHESAAKQFGREPGEYVTAFTGNLSAVSSDDTAAVLSGEIRRFLPEGKGAVLVVGLGNQTVTPDALGPETAEKVLATRHISKETAVAIGLDHLTPVAVLAPGVLGQTGMETAEIIESVVAKINPRAVIAIDALTARSLSHLGSTVQLTDTGIAPGSGVKNHRTEISRKTLGVPVIAVGVPTVVHAETLAEELGKAESGSELIVTPKDIDGILSKASAVLSLAINLALQPDLDAETLREYLE